jgi:hypothetical protein
MYYSKMPDGIIHLITGKKITGDFSSYTAIHEIQIDLINTDYSQFNLLWPAYCKPKI